MNRRKPFSGKKKKEQLKAKRKRQRGDFNDDEKHENNNNNVKINITKPEEKDKLKTVFEREPDEVIKKRIEEGRKPLNRETPDVFNELYSSIIDIPKRPEWNRNMTKEELESNEERMFKKYLEGIYDKYSSSLNYFEHNLEVWRELWRTCEISDVLLIIADIRHPMFHFPPALYNYVVNDLKKPLILVLTKCDLVPKENLIKWRKYFEEHFPKLKVSVFCSYQRLNEKDEEGNIMTMKKKRRARRIYRPTGVEEILDILNSYKIKKRGRTIQVEYKAPNQGSLEDILGSLNDSSEEDEDYASENENIEEERDEILKNLGELELEADDYYSENKRERSYITLGLIGNPNVGKSTFINAMKGYRVCSTSRTPGHTKRRQTIFLTEDLMLCDCPGLVFPAVDMPRQLQILCGIFPIAQVREPYSAIKYLAECIPVEKVYNLEPLNDDPWSAWSICEAYAEKRGYRTKSGRLDTHRAGREILFDVIDGRIVLYFLPDQAHVNIGFYINSEMIHDPLKRASISESEESEEESV